MATQTSHAEIEQVGEASNLEKISQSKSSVAAKFVPVCHFDQFIDACFITYQQYFKHGYIEKRESQLAFSFRDLCPNAVTFVAVALEGVEDISAGQVIGSLTTITGEVDALPSAETYREEFEALPLSGKLLGEGTKFALLDEVRKLSPHLARDFVQENVRWWSEAGFAYIFVVVHPHHAAFWRRVVKFQVLSEAKPCPRVSGSPGVLLFLDLNLNRIKDSVGWESNSEFLAHLRLRVPVGRPRFQIRQLRDFEIVTLLLLEPSVIETITEKHRTLVHASFPSLGRYLTTFERRYYSSGTENCGILQIQIVNIEQHIGTVFYAFNPLLKERGIEASWKIAPEVPCTVIANSYRFLEVLICLVRFFVNSANSSASVNIEVSNTSRDTQTLELQFRVTAKGLSSTQDVEEIILNKNLKSVSSIFNSARKTNEKIVMPELLGGEFRWGVDYSEHTCCEFTLRAAREDNCNQAAAILRQKTLPQEKFSDDLEFPKVLVASANLVERLTCSFLLRRLGYDTIDAINAENAISLFTEYHPSIVLLSDFLPGKDGYDTVRILRRIESSLNVSSNALVIAMLSSTRKRDEREAYRAGFNCCLVRPFCFAELKSVVPHSGVLDDNFYFFEKAVA